MLKQSLAKSQKYNRFENSGKIRSQRLINAMLEAKRDNPSMTENELYYVSFGFKESQRG